MIHRTAVSVDGLCLLAPLIVAENEQRKVPKMEVIEDDRESHDLLPPDCLDLLDAMAVRNKVTLGQIAERIQIASHAPCNEDFLGAIRDSSSHYGYSFDNQVLQEPFLRPTLIITGRQDIVVGYEDAWGILDYYPAATFVLLHGTGHLLEAKDIEIRTHFERWLQTLPGWSAESS